MERTTGNDTAWIEPKGGPGAPPAPRVDVSFGPRETEVMSVEWASGVLTWLKQNNPAVFGAAMLGYLEVEHKRPGRKPAV